MKKRLFCVFLSILLTFLSIPLQDVIGFGLTAEAAIVNSTERYTIVILDVSGSMEGKPLAVQKQAAIKFCKSLLNSEGKNYIALVQIDSSSSKLCDFTNDFSTLENYINSTTDNGGTDTAGAFTIAHNLFTDINNIEGTTIKNIVLCTDGQPDNNDEALSIANSLKSSYNIYALGFFHNLSGSDLKSASSLLKQFASSENMYYQVTDVNDLEFVFGALVDDVVENTLKNTYIKDHIAYAKSNEYTDFIKSGFRSNMEQVLNDVVTDKGIGAYNTFSLIANSLNLDFKDKNVDDFQLVIASLMAADVTDASFKENFILNFVKNITNYASKLASWGSSIDAINSTDFSDINKCLNIMNSNDPFSSTYNRAFDNLIAIFQDIDDNSVLNAKGFIKNLSSEEFIIGIGTSWCNDICDSIQDCLYFFSFGNAYVQTSDDFIKILKRMVVAIYETDYNDFNGIKELDRITYYNSFITALQEFYTNMEQYKYNGAKEFIINNCKKLTGSMALDLAKNLGETCVDSILSCVPIIRWIPIFKSGINITKMFIDIFSSVDDRSASAQILKKYYFMNVIIYNVIRDCKAALKEGDFEAAALFDEAIAIYKISTELACDRGMEYEKFLIGKNGKKKSSWHSTAISLAACEKLCAENIMCHRESLTYNHVKKEFYSTNDGKPYNGKKVKVFTIACPVSVNVTDSSGNWIADISDNGLQVKEGYEPYFHIISEDNGEYTKVAMVPIDYNLTITGTGTGMMNVYVASVNGTEINEEQEFENIAVSDKTVWQLEKQSFNSDKFNLDKENGTQNYTGALDIAHRISIGKDHCGFITNDKSLYLWGSLFYSQNNNSYTTNINIKPVKALDNVIHVSLGNAYSAAITSNGDLYTWGVNTKGQLGDGTSIGSDTPVKIMSNIIQASAGVYHTAAITSNGDLYTWGDNTYGQLGNGTTTNSLTPVKVLSDVIQVCLGAYNSAAITSNGDLYMWGDNRYGQLGNGTDEKSTIPIKVFSDVVMVSVNGNLFASDAANRWCAHSAAITSNGDLYTWGDNTYGQLGNGTTTNSLFPIKVMDDIIQVSLGSRHSSALTKDGFMYTWGQNNEGQLGNRTTESSTIPICILNDVSNIALGYDNSMALKKDGSLYLWGDNENGQLFDFSYIDSNVPIKVDLSKFGKNVSSTIEQVPDDTINNTTKTAHNIFVNSGIASKLSAVEGEYISLAPYIENGYEFVEWTSNEGTNIFDDYLNPYTQFCMPDKDVTIVAVTRYVGTKNSVTPEVNVKKRINQNLKLKTTKKRYSTKQIKKSSKKFYIKATALGGAKITYKLVNYPVGSKKYFKITNKGKVTLNRGLKKEFIKLKLQQRKQQYTRKE